MVEWKALTDRQVEHAWQTHPFAKAYCWTACGLMYGIDVPVYNKGGRHCKNCERAIKSRSIGFTTGK